MGWVYLEASSLTRRTFEPFESGVKRDVQTAVAGGRDFVPVWLLSVPRHMRVCFGAYLDSLVTRICGTALSARRPGSSAGFSACSPNRRRPAVELKFGKLPVSVAACRRLIVGYSEWALPFDTPNPAHIPPSWASQCVRLAFHSPLLSEIAKYISRASRHLVAERLAA